MSRQCRRQPFSFGAKVDPRELKLLKDVRARQVSLNCVLWNQKHVGQPGRDVTAPPPSPQRLSHKTPFTPDDHSLLLLWSF